MNIPINKVDFLITLIFLVPRSIILSQVTEVSVQLSLATIEVSWSVSFDDDLAKPFYGYQVQYNCDSGSSWTNGSSVLASNINKATVAGLNTNVICQVRIAPVSIFSNVAINEQPSNATTFSSMYILLTAIRKISR